MKFLTSIFFLSGVLSGVTSHSHSDHHNPTDQIPLHEQAYTQDSNEELERKWGFEVSIIYSFAVSEISYVGVVSLDCGESD
jgi:hypothetical protein